MKLQDMQPGQIIRIEGKETNGVPNLFTVTWDPERKRIFAWSKRSQDLENPLQRYAEFVMAEELSFLTEEWAGKATFVDQIAPPEPLNPPHEESPLVTGACKTGACLDAVRRFRLASEQGGFEIHRALWIAAGQSQGLSGVLAQIASVQTMIHIGLISSEACILATSYKTPPEAQEMQNEQAAALVRAGYLLGLSEPKDTKEEDESDSEDLENDTDQDDDASDLPPVFASE